MGKYWKVRIRGEKMTYIGEIYLEEDILADQLTKLCHYHTM